MIMKADEIGQYLLAEINGKRRLRYQCPDCGIWVNGPVLLQYGEAHLWETWPTWETNEILSLLTEWIKRLTPYAEVALPSIHFHLEIVDKNFEPDIDFSGRVEYWLNGEHLTRKEFVGGNFDAVLIRLEPGYEFEEVERILLHELLHVAFPAGGVDWNTRDWGPKFEEMEEFIEGKVEEFLAKFGNFRTFIKTCDVENETSEGDSSDDTE